MRGIRLPAVFPNFRATNMSVSGSTSLEHASKQIPRLPVAGSNVLGLVVMTTGGNDIIHDYGRSKPREGAMFGATLEQARPWIENFERRLDEMLGAITKKFPGGCHIFLADIYDPTDGVGDISTAGLPGWKEGLDVLRAYNQAIFRVSKRHANVYVVPMHDAFLGHGIHCTNFWRTHFNWRDPHYWFHDNLEDPNDRGYDAIRRLMLIEMHRVLANHAR